MQIVIFATDQSFNQQGYGFDTVKAASKFYKMQMDQKTPSYVEAFITKNTIEDEAGLVQVG